MVRRTAPAAALLVVLLSSASALAQEPGLERAFQSAASAVSSFKERAPRPEPAEPLVELVLYHTNDIHGHIEGAPALATLLKRERRPHLWIDAGDWFSGTPEGNLTRGKAVIDVMNRVGADAAVTGNHEYDYGTDALKALVRKADFPVLGANIGSRGEIGNVKPYVVKKLGGVRIAVIGLLTGNMAGLQEPERTAGLNFIAPAAAARGYVDDILRNDRADLIVAATHQGERADKALAKAVPEIRVILGGHDHTELDPAAREPNTHGETVITQTKGALGSVYQVTLFVTRRAHELRRVETRLLKLDGGAYPPDPDIAAIVAAHQAAVDKGMSVPLGSAAAALPHVKGTVKETPLGDWFTDAMRAYAKADAAVMNTGGIRTGLPAGPLVYRDLYSVYPFEDYVVVMSISGAELKASIEKALGPDGSFLAFSGLEVLYDPKAPAGQRLLELRVGGAPADDARVYTVAATSFVAKVSPSFGAARKTASAPLPDLLRDALADEIRRASPLAAPAGGRLVAR